MKYKKQTVCLSLISDVICDYFEINDKILIFKPTRKIEYILRRQWFYYFARTLNPEHIVSGRIIGEYYSDVTGHTFDHATILHAVRKIKGYIDVSKKDREIKKDIALLINNKINSNYKPPLKRNCATQPFKIFRYGNTKKSTPTSIILSL